MNVLIAFNPSIRIRDVRMRNYSRCLSDCVSVRLSELPFILPSVVAEAGFENLTVQTDVEQKKIFSIKLYSSARKVMSVILLLQ